MRIRTIAKGFRTLAQSWHLTAAYLADAAGRAMRFWNVANLCFATHQHFAMNESDIGKICVPLDCSPADLATAESSISDGIRSAQMGEALAVLHRRHPQMASEGDTERRNGTIANPFRSFLLGVVSAQKVTSSSHAHGDERLNGGRFQEISEAPGEL